MTKAEVRQMLRHTLRHEFKTDYCAIYAPNQDKVCNLCGGGLYKIAGADQETRYYGYTYKDYMICADCYNRDPSQPIPSRCQHCNEAFDSRNKLFEHLKCIHHLDYGSSEGMDCDPVEDMDCD